MTDFSAYFNVRRTYENELSYPTVNDPELILQDSPLCPQCEIPSKYSIRHVIHNGELTWTRCLEFIDSKKSMNPEKCLQYSFCDKCKINH